MPGQVVDGEVDDDVLRRPDVLLGEDDPNSDTAHRAARGLVYVVHDLCGTTSGRDRYRGRVYVVHDLCGTTSGRDRYRGRVYVVHDLGGTTSRRDRYRAW